MDASAGRRVPGVVAMLSCALLLAACDGGIFGTGDGSGVGPPVDASSPSASGESTTDAGGDAGTEGPDDAGGDAADGGATDVPSAPGTDPARPTAPSSPFANTLITGDTSTPRVRLVNASGARMTLADADGEPILPAGLAPLQIGDYAGVALGTESLTVRRLADTGATDVYRLEPLTLGASSVTTLVVRDRDASDEGGVDVVPLPTLTSPTDPAQSLVRIVQSVRPRDGEGAAETFTLVPDGVSPGGAEVALEGVAFDTAPSDTGYGSVPAGDYSLSGSNGAVSSLPLSFEGDTVYTLVIVGTDRILRVVDGAPDSR